MYLNFLTQPVYLFIALFVKESVGFFLLRITGGVKYRILIISIMVVLAVYTVACFFTIVLQCRDLRIIWNPTVETTCWSIHVMRGLSYTNSVVNIVTDFAFAVLIPVCTLSLSLFVFLLSLAPIFPPLRNTPPPTQ